MSKGFVVGRSTYEAPARGGSLTSEWRSSQFDTTTLTKDGKTTHDQVRLLAKQEVRLKQISSLDMLTCHVTI